MVLKRRVLVVSWRWQGWLQHECLVAVSSMQPVRHVRRRIAHRSRRRQYVLCGSVLSCCLKSLASLGDRPGWHHPGGGRWQPTVALLKSLDNGKGFHSFGAQVAKQRGRDYGIGHCTIWWPISAHASQAFSSRHAYTSARDCTDSEHLPKKIYHFHNVRTKWIDPEPSFDGSGFTFTVALRRRYVL